MEAKVLDKDVVVSTSPLVKTYTLDEFWQLPDPTTRHKLELIGGVLYMPPLPDEFTHDPVVSCLCQLLIEGLSRLGRPGIILVPRSGILTYHLDTWLEPDLFYLTNESVQRFKGKPRTSADLVIEVLSPGSSDYDRTTKADSYAFLGVRELWLVDPDERAVEVRYNSGKAWVEARVFRKAEQIASHVLAGLQLSVADIFAD